MYLSEHFGRAFWIDDNSNDFNLTEEVYKEVKKCYNSSNLEDNNCYIDSLLTTGI